MNKEPGPWRLWHTVALRRIIKKMMKPRTHSQVYSTKTYLSFGYLLCTGYLFHRIALRGLEKTAGTSDIEKAVNLNISEAKIVRVEGFKLKEVIDYRRDDYPELIENRPAYVRD